MVSMGFDGVASVVLPDSGSTDGVVDVTTEMPDMDGVITTKPGIASSTLEHSVSPPAPTTSTTTMLPHVAFIMVDDVGFNDFIDTKDMQAAWEKTFALRASGILINRSYSDAICAPSRRA